MDRQPRTRTAFALRELAAVLALTAIVFILALVTGDRARRNAQLGLDMVKLHESAAGTFLYANDHADRFWSLSWKRNILYTSPWPDLNFATTDIQAQANQAVMILRGHGGRPDMPRFSGVLANVRYSHLPLAVYLDAPLPWFTFISSGDENLLRWASDPACHDQGCFIPCQVFGNHPRQPYRASFQLTPACWDQSPSPYRISQPPSGTIYDLYAPHNSALGGNRLSDVSVPSQKVIVMDDHARHFGRDVQYSFNHLQARLPLLFADGSVHVKKSADANPGWNPWTPTSATPLLLRPHSLRGRCTPGVFRWTRSDLAGRDFGGPEVWLPAPASSTGAAPQPAPPPLIAEP